MGKPLDEVNRPGDRIQARHFNELRREIKRHRVLHGPGTARLQTPAGLLVSPESSGGTVVRIRTTSAISGRVSATPGTGTAVLINWTGSALVDGSAIDLLNLAAGGWSTGKYGFASLIGGTYWITALEC